MPGNGQMYYIVVKQTNETELQAEPLPTMQKYRTNQNISETGTTTKESLTSIEDKALALSIPMTVSADLQQLDETVKSMMETSQNMFPIGKRQERGKKCNVCGKEGHATDIKRHIEAFHMEGVEIPCNHCDKLFRSRDGLRQHISKHHRQQ